MRQAGIVAEKVSSPLSNGFTFCPSTFSTTGITVECRGVEATFARMFVNGLFVRTENSAPYTIAGDTAGKSTAWNPPSGTVSISCTTDKGSTSATGKFECQNIPPSTRPTLVNSGRFRSVSVVGSTIPSKRLESSAVFVAGKVYLVGGKGRKNLFAFDPKARTWEDKGPHPAEMHHIQAVVVGAKIYVPGAWFGNWPKEKTHESMFVYDTTNGKWSTLPNPPSARRRGAGAVGVYKNKIYIAAGSSGGHGAPTTLLPYLDMFDPAQPNAGWKALPNIPDARDHVYGAVVGDFFCVGGGRQGNKDDYLAFPVLPINCYNLMTNVWERRKSLGIGRSGAPAAATCQGLLMIAGGEGRSPNRSGNQAFKQVDLYDPKTDTFVTPPLMMNSPRHGTGAAVTDCGCGNIYLPAGAGGAGVESTLNDIVAWSPDGVVRNC